MSLDEIKAQLKAKRLVLGTDITLKRMKQAKLSKVFFSSNCPESVKADIAHYCTISGCASEQLDLPNEELGTFCKKPFAVSVLGILKQ